MQIDSEQMLGSYGGNGLLAVNFRSGELQVLYVLKDCGLEVV